MMVRHKVGAALAVGGARNGGQELTIKSIQTVLFSQEMIADTDPTNGLSFFHIEAITKASPAEVSFQSSTNRAYTLWSTPQLSPVDWTPVPEVVAIPGTGGMMTLMDATNAPQQFYRVEVNLP